MNIMIILNNVIQILMINGIILVWIQKLFYDK